MGVSPSLDASAIYVFFCLNKVDFAGPPSPRLDMKRGSDGAGLGAQETLSSTNQICFFSRCPFSHARSSQIW